MRGAGEAAGHAVENCPACAGVPEGGGFLATAPNEQRVPAFEPRDGGPEFRFRDQGRLEEVLRRRFPSAALSHAHDARIFAAVNATFHKIVMPILDFMQTMPAFVYLIPAIPFFGLGKVSAAFATVIFAVPPSIRLTALGIRQIDPELIEASDSFGTTPTQKLVKVQMPLDCDLARALLAG